MKYMLFHCDDGESDTLEGPDGVPTAWFERITERGLTTEGSRLWPKAQAVTVRVRDGQVLVTDGPFAETKEQLWGLYVVDAPDLDHVLDETAELWEAKHGTIEIRPLIRPPQD